MLQHMVVISYDSAEQSLIGTVEHFLHIFVDIFIQLTLSVRLSKRYHQ